MFAVRAEDSVQSTTAVMVVSGQDEPELSEPGRAPSGAGGPARSNPTNRVTPVHACSPTATRMSAAKLLPEMIETSTIRRTEQKITL